MTTWHEYLQQHNLAPEWPYPIRYGSERRMDEDVLVLGGGIAGCHAAISARKRGARVVVLEKGATKWSGNGGAGVDHWLSACTNPCSEVTPEAFTERAMADSQGYDCGPVRYVNAKEGWDALLDCEQMGMQIRPTPNRAVAFDAGICVGCNRCVEICRSDVLMPSPEKSRPPIVLYPDECWYCGTCVLECPHPGAIAMLHPLNQSISVVWKRKETGEHYRLGMRDPPPPNERPPAE